MSRFRRRIHVSFLLLYADAVTAIHEGPGHASRHEAPIDELMRRDGFRVSSRPLSKTSRAKDDAEAMPISEQAQKDFKAVEAVLAEGTPVRLPDLDSDSLQERLGRHGDVSTREESDALLQENAGAAPPYGPLGLGSLGSFSNFGSMGYGPGMSSGASSGSPFLSSFSGVLGSPKSPSPSGMPMPPLASSVASKESKDKKEIDFNNIDYIGCIIPQWTDGDWICAEAVDVPDMQIYDDAQHRSSGDRPQNSAEREYFLLLGAPERSCARAMRAPCDAPTRDTGKSHSLLRWFASLGAGEIRSPE